MISQSYSIRISTQSTSVSPPLLRDQTSLTIFLLRCVFKNPRLLLRNQPMLRSQLPSLNPHCRIV